MFKLIRYSTPPPAQDNLIERHHWPIKIDALQLTAPDTYTPAKIFVIHQAPPGGLFADFFSCVASVQQMEDLPEDEPSEGVPFYRVDSITQLCRTPAAAEEFWEAVRSVTQELADNLQAAENLEIADEVIITPT